MVTTKNFLSVDLSLISMKPWLRSFLVTGQIILIVVLWKRIFTTI